ncbi:MAG: flagellar assembly protein FliW [Desulfuromonadales bacterium]|nr:MAG: flagellar assembly protein FliW [Desulfuromonadales bacterium]
MNVQTKRFGEIAVDESRIIHMPEGMLGFAEKRFILLTPPELGPFCWYQSVDNAELAFVVVDTKDCFPGYAVNFTGEECEKLGLDESSEVIFLSVVTMAADPAAITVNLQGPIALNPDRMLAKQIVLEGGKFTTKHPFFSDVAKDLLAGAAARRSGAVGVMTGA